MTFAAPSAIDRGEASDDAEAAVPRSLEALCRTARVLFDVAAASIVIAGGARRFIDVASSAADAHWSFVTSRPEAARGAGDGLAMPDGSGPELVTGPPGLRLVASIGLAGNGRLSLFDTKPRHMDGLTQRRLDDLAILAGTLLGLERRAEEAILREEHFRLLAETSTDTIVRGNLDGIRLYVSPAVRELLGYEPEALIGRRAMEITHPDDVPTFRGIMQEIQRGDLTLGRIELRMRHLDGAWVWMEAHIRMTHDRRTGEADGYVASVRAIGERKRIEAQLEHMATHDELTGLPNRKLFRETLLRAARRMQEGGRLALLWIDVDRFKDINDGLGHQAGDLVLTEVARRLRLASRPGDMVARIGGDEFALIGETGEDRAEAGALAARIITSMKAPIPGGGHAIEIGLSIGIALSSDSGRDPDELLAAADKALYEAKSAGRNTFRFDDPSHG